MATNVEASEKFRKPLNKKWEKLWKILGRRDLRKINDKTEEIQVVVESHRKNNRRRLVYDWRDCGTTTVRRNNAKRRKLVLMI